MTHPRARLTAGLTGSLAAGLTVGALSLAGLAAAAPAQATPDARAARVVATPDPAPATAVAGWLTRHLKDGLLQYSTFDAANYGASIDAARSLAANDLQPATVQTISDAVASHIGDYISGDAFGDTGSTYAGPTAKAIRMAQTAGADPHTYGGVDLITRLEARVSTAPTSLGRISDASMYGDNANTIGQALASSALFLADSPDAGVVTDYLLLQQCGAGFFRLGLGATTTDTCDAGTDAGSVDVTAIAVMELQEQRETPLVADAITKANDWLAGAQRPDGGFSSDADITAANANSTGLAAAALGVSGRGALAAKAAVWVRQRQLVGAGTCQPFAAVDRGALAYDQPAYDGVLSGDTTTETDQFKVAAAQALAGLAFAPGGNPTATSTAPPLVKTRSTITVRVANAPAGGPVCVSTFGFQQLKVTGPTGAAGVVVTLPVKPALRTVHATGPGYDKTITRRVLGSTLLKVALAKQQVVVGGQQSVRVSGLAPHEPVHLTYRGMPLGHGVATAAGVFTKSFDVYRKVGTFKVMVTGQFPNIRKGVAPFRVIR